MKWIGLIILLPLSLSGCAAFPAISALLPAATAAVDGHGVTLTIDVMSHNTTCSCPNCAGGK